MEITDQGDVYRFMVECSADIIFLLDDQDRFVFLNDRVETLTAFKKQELIGEHFSTLLHPDESVSQHPGYQKNKKLSEFFLMRSTQLRFQGKPDSIGECYFDVKMMTIPDKISKECNQVLPEIKRNNGRVNYYGVARDISQLKSLENIIKANANYDYLTGLPNRALLEDRVKQVIAHAKRDAAKFVVMFFDLDGFKQVNDIFGHSAGDILLQSMSVRLTTCLREADTLARVGGDEFVLLLPGNCNLEEIRVIADKMLHEINTPFVISGYRISLTASIGVSLYPDNGETFHDLVKAADRAMYHIKRQTKNGYAFLSELPPAARHANIFNYS